jgi:hypothetical protein
MATWPHFYTVWHYSPSIFASSVAVRMCRCCVPHSANTDGSLVCVLFCSVLFCSVLFCSVLFCSVLFCSVLFCSVLFCSLGVCPYVKIQDPQQVVIWGSQLYGESYSALVKGNVFEIQIVTVVCVACTCVRHTLRFWNVRWHCRQCNS